MRETTGRETIFTTMKITTEMTICTQKRAMSGCPLPSTTWTTSETKQGIPNEKFVRGFHE